MTIYGSAISIDYLDGMAAIYGNCGTIFESGPNSLITINGDLDRASAIDGILRVNGSIRHMDRPEFIQIYTKALYQYDRLLIKDGEVLCQPINIERPRA